MLKEVEQELPYHIFKIHVQPQFLSKFEKMIENFYLCSEVHHDPGGRLQINRYMLTASDSKSRQAAQTAEDLLTELGRNTEKYVALRIA